MSSLPRFQHQLQEALEGASSALDDFVGVRLPALEGAPAQLWLIDAGDLQSTAEVAARSTLGGLQPWVLGISQVRGQVHTLADMAVILGHVQVRKAPASGRLWATLLHARFDTPLALVWPELVGMVPREDLVPAPQPVSHPWVRRQWQDAAGQVWSELAVEQLVLARQFNEVWQSAPGLSSSPSSRTGENP